MARPSLVGDDPGHHGVRPDLGPVGQGVGDVGDQRRGLGVDLAALEAEPPIDAVGPVTEAAVGDRHRTDAGLDTERMGPADEDLPIAAQGLGRIRVTMRIAPGPRLTGDRELFLDRLVVGLEVLVADGPVGPYPITGGGLEVRGVKARCVAGVVDHRSPDAASRVVGAERNRVGPADDPRLGPIEAMRTPLVADPVGIGIPERAGIETHDGDPGAGQALDEGGSPGPAADDDHVDFVVFVVVTHVAPQAMIGALVPGRQQPGRLVARSYVGVTEATHLWPTPNIRFGCSSVREARLMGPLGGFSPLGPRHRIRGILFRAFPLLSAVDVPCSCSPADRRDRRNPSRSMPTGGSRTPCRRSGSTGSRGGRH